MIFPLKKKVRINKTAHTFKSDYILETEIPLGEHPGSFGFKRANHIHEGVDLYAENNDEVLSINEGKIIGIFPFTGQIAGSDWWNDTWCVLVNHNEFVINYGEVIPCENLKVGNTIYEGQTIGYIEKVLKVDKGRPMSMLHLEMYLKDTIKPISEWALNEEKPVELLDPTDLLLSIAKINL